MKNLFEEWYNLNKDEIKREYIKIHEQEHGYSRHYAKWSIDFSIFLDTKLEQTKELIEEYKKGESCYIADLLIEKAKDEGYYD